jgi:hypothetical protein
LKLKFLLLALAFNTLFAVENNYILKHDGLIDQRAQDKINEIGLEAKNRLGINVYTFIIENNGIDPSAPRDERRAMMNLFNNKIIDSLDVKSSYAVLIISIDQKYTGILVSDDLKKYIDKDDILDGYVVPLLASKDKNSLFSKTSAATLNGYAQIADSIAEHQGIELVSSIGSAGKTASSIWRVFMYFLVVTGIIAYTVIVMKQRKVK